MQPILSVVDLHMVDVQFDSSTAANFSFLAPITSTQCMIYFNAHDRFQKASRRVLQTLRTSAWLSLLGFCVCVLTGLFTAFRLAIPDSILFLVALLAGQDFDLDARPSNKSLRAAAFVLSIFGLLLNAWFSSKLLSSLLQA